MNHKDFAIQILQNLDHYLLQDTVPEIEEALQHWHETLPLIQKLTKEHKDKASIAGHLKTTEKAANQIRENEYSYLNFSMEISNLATTILDTTDNMEEWSIYFDEEDPESPFQLIQNERVGHCKRRSKS